MQDKESFWSDFKGRVRMHPQHEPAAAAPRGVIVRWAAAAACTVLLLTGVIVYQLRNGGAVQPAGGNVISWLDVQVPHAAVIMMNNDPEEGTVVWIVDPDVDSPEGDSA